MTDVLNSVCEKLISRHPHIYGDVHVKDEEDVKKNWEQLKLKEGNKSVLAGVPNSMPSMIKASRMQDKAAQIGFSSYLTSILYKYILIVGYFTK